MVVEECPYWTPEFRAAAEVAKTFEGLARVALSVLKTMQQPISQLCGPISTGGFGCRDQNTKVFARCVVELRRQGENPFDQGPLQVAFDSLITRWREKHGDRYCTPIISVVYRTIFESGLVTKVYCLRKWGTSFGARMERTIVGRLPYVKIYRFPPAWYQSILTELGLAD